MVADRVEAAGFAGPGAHGSTPGPDHTTASWWIATGVVGRWTLVLVAAAVGAVGWWSYRAPVVGRGVLPDPIFSVVPGMVPVAPVTWRGRGARPVVVPTPAVTRFPYGGARPRAGAGELFVQVLHFDSAQTERHRLRYGPGAAGPMLRFRVELRAVRARAVAPGQLAISGVAPHELVVARYIYPLGGGDLVSGEAVSMRDLELPQLPPALPVAVTLDRVARAIEVRLPRADIAVATFVTPGGVHMRLEPDGRVLVVRVPLRDLPEQVRALLAFDQRPTLNVGWLEARSASGGLVVDTAVRL